MTKDLIEVGTIVILKSGSPYMTVQKLIGDDTVECCWFDKKSKNSHLKISTFKRLSLLTFIPHSWDIIEEIHNGKNNNPNPNGNPIIETKRNDSYITIIFCIMYLFIGILIGAMFL